MLYGCVVRSRFEDPSSLILSDITRFASIAGFRGRFKWRIRKLVLYGNASTTFNLIKALCRGLPLKAACAEAGTGCPDDPLGQLMLAATEASVAGSFVLRPPVFQGTNETAALMRDGLWTSASPVGGAPALVGSIFLLDKGSLFERCPRNSAIASYRNSFARDVLRNLSDSAGMDFTRNDAGRLGNIEWIAFPTADVNENSLVEVTPFSPKENASDSEQPGGSEPAVAASIAGRGVTVQVLPGALPVGTRLLVRCRLHYDDIVLDQCQMTTATEEAAKVVFHASEDFGSVLVSVWQAEASGGMWSLWYEDSFTLCKQLDFCLGFLGLEGRLESAHFARYERSRAELRAKELQKIEQITYSPGAISRRGFSPWVQSARDARRWARRIFPDKSGGGFFPNGWGEEGPGFLSFVEWFINLTESTEKTTLLVVDPYLDAPAIELLARARSTQTHYKVLTNTQVPSYDDSTESPSRTARIVEACNRMDAILGRLHFSVLDLQSKGGGKNQLFHDRYILVCDGSDVALKGFHLSNSLQSATQKVPLLVTPIPDDLLADVTRYVYSLLSARAPFANDAKVATLYSTSAEFGKMGHESRPRGLNAIPDPGPFFAALLGEKEMGLLDRQALTSRLRDEGLMAGDDRFLVPDEGKLQYAVLARELLVADAHGFATLWTAFSEWLARVATGKDYLSEFASANDDRLAQPLRRFLETESAPQVTSPRIRRQVAGKLHLLREGFSSCLRDAELLLSYHDPFWQGLGNWPDMYAAEALAELDLNALSGLFEGWRNSLPPMDNAPMCAAIAPRFAQLVGAVVVRLTGTEHRTALSPLLGSGVPLLRALAAASTWAPKQTVLRPLDTDEAIAGLAALLPEDRIWAFARWVGGLVIASSGHGPIEPDAVRDTRKKVLAELVKLWPSDSSGADLRRLVSQVGGPTQGGLRGAVSVNDGLLLLLHDAGKLTSESIGNFWLGEIHARLSSSSIHFFDPDDTELTEVSAHWLAHCKSAGRAFWKAKLDRVRAANLRVIREPFSRTKNYTRWHEAYSSMQWLSSLLALSWIILQDESLDQPNEAESLKSQVTSLSVELQQFRQSEPIGEHDRLSAFAVRVGHMFEKRLDAQGERAGQGECGDPIPGLRGIKH